MTEIEPDFYAKAGVNVSLGDTFSAFAARVCRSTWNNSLYVEVRDFARGHFRGPRAFDFVNLPPGCMKDGGMDGVGTKTGIIAAALSPRTAGRDLLAMTAMDRTRWGNLPLYFDNILDVSTLGADESDPAYQFFCDLFEGLAEAAREIGIVLGYGGETAELGPFVGSENPSARIKFNWGGHMSGVMHPDRIIRGDRMRPGDVVIALRERGFRSNGLSAVRKAFAIRFGKEWWNNPGASAEIKAAAEPSVLYDRFLAEMNGWYPRGLPAIPIHCIAHISGGGIPSKFAHDILFPLGLSAELDDLPDPPPIMQRCAEWYEVDGRRIPDAQCYKTWHGGVGALVVVPRECATQFSSEAAVYGLDAQKCGRITKDDEPRLVIVSRFGSGKSITYTP